MGPIFIVFAINTNRVWLKNICFLLAILGSVASVLGSGAMVYIAIVENIIAWALWIGVGYAIRFGIQRIKRQLKKQ